MSSTLRFATRQVQRQDEDALFYVVLWIPESIPYIQSQLPVENYISQLFCIPSNKKCGYTNQFERCIYTYMYILEWLILLCISVHTGNFCERPLFSKTFIFYLRSNISVLNNSNSELENLFSNKRNPPPSQIWPKLHNL